MLKVEVKPKPKLLVLVGPTAVGKTRMSIELAQAFNCEIISGDSMQVYREMDIGTAKITSEEMKGVPHHLIDIHEPEYPYSVAEFQESCTRLISEIHERGKMPFIVGGTGLYVESVCYGFQFSDSGSDEAFREEQFSYAELNGAQALHDRLRKLIQLVRTVCIRMTSGELYVRLRSIISLERSGLISWQYRRKSRLMTFLLLV